MTRQTSRQVLLVALGACLLRAAVFLGTELYADEAYYWLWSTRLAGGYFDHPPMVAYVAWLSSFLPGELGLRALFLLLGAAPVCFAAAIAAELSEHPRAPLVAALLAATAPMLTLGGALALPDAPQLAFYSGATWLLTRATGPRWLGVGALYGLALLSKYSSAIFGPAVLLCALVEPSLRAELRTRWPYLGALVATAIFLPCIAWNASHDFVSFAFQLRHGFNDAGFGKHLPEYLGAVIGGAGPVVAIAGVMRLVRPGSPAAMRVAFVTLAPLAVTTYSALRGKVEANWPAVAYPALCAAAAVLIVGHVRARRWLVAGSMALGLIVALLYAVEVRHPRLFAPNAPPIERFHGWAQQAAQIRELCEHRFIVPSNYQYASQLAWHLGWRRFGPTWGRPSQFDLWDDAPAPGEPRCVVHGRPLNAHERDALDVPADVEPQRVDATLEGRRVRTLWVTRVP